jgi:ribosome maturation factor RimP
MASGESGVQRAPIEEIRKVAAGVVEDQGLELVDLVLRGPRGRQMLRVDVERPGPCGVTLDDCQRVSEELAARLDDSDLIPSAYTLEVSSPGLDRPLRSTDDFRRNVGRVITIEVHDAERGGGTIEGKLIEQDREHVVIESTDGTRTRVETRHITRARQSVRARPDHRVGV